jgi:hypothetical protein
MTVQAGSTIQKEISSQVVVGVPFIIAPTGSVATGGVVTLGTALPATYLGGLFLYFPAGALYSGSTAGWYWTVMSSATVGVAYNINYVSGQPVIPPAANLVSNLITAAGPGAYTGVVTAQLITIPLNNNILGNQGFARFTEFFETNNSAGTKTFIVTLQNPASGASATLYTATATTSTSTVAGQFLQSNGSQQVNVATLNSATSPYGVQAQNQINVNFGSATGSTPVNLVISLQIAVATDVVGVAGLFGEFFFNS